MSKCIRLMIADDHAIMREGLKQIFALDDNIDVVCEASDSGQVLERCVSTKSICCCSIFRCLA